MVKSRTCRTSFSSVSQRCCITGQLVTSPKQRRLARAGWRSSSIDSLAALFIVIAAHHRTIHRLHCLQAFHGIRSITDDVTEADEIGTALFLSIPEHCLECFKITVDVTKDCELIRLEGWA